MEMEKRKKFKLLRNGKQFLFNSFVICSVISFFVLFFARYVFVNKSSQDIATTLSGTLGTALGFFGSILVYNALREQVKANKLIQKQFKVQAFESRLYKMLDIYNLNVNNLKFKNRKTGLEYRGKNVFPAIISDYRKLKDEIETFNNDMGFDIDAIIIEEYRKKLITINGIGNVYNSSILEITYLCLFFGVGVNGRPNITALFKDKYDNNYLKTLLNYLSNKPASHNSKEKHKRKWKELMIPFELFIEPNNKKFDKYYNGHQNNLGHYYRHIFMIIKFIDQQPMFTYLEKWEYSKLLRTQLSNHEQELFFLNSISILGRDWELNQDGSNGEFENKRFITKYDLIKNVSKSVINKYNIKSFYPNVEFEYEDDTQDRRDLNENVYL